MVCTYHSTVWVRQLQVLGKNFSNFLIHQLSVKFLDNLLNFSTLHAARHSMLQNFDPPSESPDYYGAFTARCCSMLCCSRIQSNFLEFRHSFDDLSTFSRSFFEFFLDPAARLDFFSIFLEFFDRGSTFRLEYRLFRDRRSESPDLYGAGIRQQSIAKT